MTRTEAERLTRIETLLEGYLAQRTEDRNAMRESIDAMAADIKQIKEDVSADKADLAALKNKGVGLLVGAGLAGGAAWEAVRAIIGALK